MLVSWVGIGGLRTTSRVLPRPRLDGQGLHTSLRMGTRIYGMFAHGELGPSEFAGFANTPTVVAHEQHSMTSILAVHTAPEKDEV